MLKTLPEIIRPVNVITHTLETVRVHIWEYAECCYWKAVCAAGERM